MTEATTPTQTTRQQTPEAPGPGERHAGVTAFDAALLATFAGATTDQNASGRASDDDRAQQMRDADAARRDPTRPDIRGVARSEEAGVLRMATVTELATAELRGEGDRPVAPEQPRQRDRTSRQASAGPDRDGRSRPAEPRPSPSTERSGQGHAKAAESPSVAPGRGGPASTTGAQAAPHAAPAQAAPTGAETSASGRATLVGAVRATATQMRAGAPATQPAAVGGIGRTRGASAPGAKAEAAPSRPHVLRHAKAFQAQLARGLAAALKKGDGLVTLRLRPSSLGRLTIDLRVSDAQVTARIQASTDAARGLLESAGGELRDALAARGLNLHRLDVQLAEPSQTQPPSGHGAQHDASPNEHSADDRPRDGRSGSGSSDTPHAPEHHGDLDADPLDDLPDHASIALGVDVVV